MALWFELVSFFWLLTFFIVSSLVGMLGLFSTLASWDLGDSDLLVSFNNFPVKRLTGPQRRCPITPPNKHQGPLELLLGPP